VVGTVPSYAYLIRSAYRRFTIGVAYLAY